MGKTKDDPSRWSNWYVLVSGLSQPTSELHLGPGVTLRPLPKPLSVFDLASAGAVGFREWAAIQTLAASCTCEIESSLDGAATPGYDTLNRAWLATSLLTLRGFTTIQGLACSAYPWATIAGWQGKTLDVRRTALVERGPDALLEPGPHDLPPFRGNVLDYHFRLFAGGAPRKDSPTPEDAEWCQARFDVANRLAADSTAFRLALECVSDWRFAKEPRSAIARLWTGIESMFAVQTELVFRIALLSATLLHERGAPRRQRFAAVKKLYNLRSKAVHGAQMPEESLTDGMHASFRLLVDLLLLVISRGQMLDENALESALLD